MTVSILPRAPARRPSFVQNNSRITGICCRIFYPEPGRPLWLVNIWVELSSHEFN